MRPLLLSLVAVACLPGAIVFSNAQLYTPNTTSLAFANSGQPITVANNFQLAQPANIVAASFFFYSFGPPPPNVAITYQMLEANGFSPGAPIAGAGGTSSVYSFEELAFVPNASVPRRLDFNFTAPIALQANTDYWFAFRTTVAQQFFFSWLAPPTGTSASTLSTNYTNWTMQGVEGVFILYDTPFPIGVPEPSSGVLLAGALLAWRLRALARR